MVPDDKLRENLFGLEPLSPERQQRFREELAQIVEPRLSRGYRLYYLLGLAGCLIGLPGAVCGLLFDAEHRWIWALNLAVLLGFAGWIFYILRRGAEPMRMMQGMSKALAAVALLAAGLLIVSGIGNPSLAGVLWSLLGLLLFLLVSFINLWNRVLTAERIMREHLLRVEYRLAKFDASPR
jgi:MFS family permease